MLALVTLVSAAAGAQQHTAHDGRRDSASFEVSAQAIALLTSASPALLGRTYTEGYVTQPAIMAHAHRGRVSMSGMLNFEGLTLDRGELNAGIHGEGYIDRRHPHTYLHEFVGTVRGGSDRIEFSLSAGKGFAPFGTDDPMTRPFVKYPINHHAAQILERMVAIGAVEAGGFSAEAGLFNGDEPETPGDAPNSRNLWNSWAARVTGNVPDRFRAIGSIEAQVSYAEVISPEDARGEGLDQKKMSASLRRASHHSYFFAEWAQTREVSRGAEAYRYTSALAEGRIDIGKVGVGARVERTERPDEERSNDPFRSPRPAPDLHIDGISRWTIATLALIARPSRLRFTEPFAEFAIARPVQTIPNAIFDPAGFYGARSLWSFSAGVRLGMPGYRHRMGRYGSAAP